MRHSSYSGLPLEALYKLLTAGTIKLFDAYDSNEDSFSEFRAQKKYIEELLLVIEDKQKQASTAGHRNQQGK